MDATLRLLGAGGPLGPILLGSAVAAAIACAVAFAIGLRRMHAPGAPRRALGVAIACALPLLLPIAGSFFCVPAADGDPREAAHAALLARLVTGSAGLVLALPVGLSAGLWAGIAAGRRVRQAGERARLAARAAGHEALGDALAQRLERSSLPGAGLAIGVLAALLPIGAPALALFLAAARGLEDLAVAAALEPGAAALLGALQAEASASTLRRGAAIGATGAFCCALLLGAILHAGSSRRRNLEVARRAAGAADRRAAAAVERTLLASGRPGPGGPAALAVVLLALAAAAWIAALDLRAGAPPAGEAVAAIPAPRRSRGRNPQDHRRARLAGDRAAATIAAPMRILEFPGDVAMGGIEAQADRLADDAAEAAAQAERLALALLRGDWRNLPLPGKGEGDRRAASA